MKKLFILLCFFFLSPPMAFAADEQLPTYYLYNETFDGSGISQFFRTKDNVEHYNFIPVPSDYLNDVRKADDPLLESKKILALAYYHNGANERLAELFGQFDPEMIFADWGVDKRYKNTFDSHSDLIVSYVKKHKSEPLPFDAKGNDFQNYTSFVPEEFASLHQYDFPTSETLLEKHQKSTASRFFSGDHLYLIGVSVLVLLVTAVSYFLFRRR